MTTEYIVRIPLEKSVGLTKLKQRRTMKVLKALDFKVQYDGADILVKLNTDTKFESDLLMKALDLTGAIIVNMVRPSDRFSELRKLWKMYRVARVRGDMTTATETAKSIRLIYKNLNLSIPKFYDLELH